MEERERESESERERAHTHIHAYTHTNTHAHGRCCSMLEREDGWESAACATGGWDGVVALWDLRQATPAARWKACGKVYAMDAEVYVCV